MLCHTESLNRLNFRSGRSLEWRAVLETAVCLTLQLAPVNAGLMLLSPCVGVDSRGAQEGEFGCLLLEKERESLLGKGSKSLSYSLQT